MNRLTTYVERLDSVLKVTLAVLMATLVIDVTWQVLTRFILPQPSSFTEEVARFILIWISLVGGAFAFRTHSHLGFDLLVRNLALTNAVFVYRLCCILVAIFAIVVLIVGGMNLVFLTWSLGQQSPVLNVPMASVYVVIPLSGCLFLLYSMYFFFTASTVIQTARQPQSEEEMNDD